MDAKSLEIAKEIGWNPDHKSFFKAQMAWNSHREADRSAKQTHAAMMEAADLRSRPELSKESRKLAQLAARSAGVEGVDVTQRLLAPSSTRRSAHASSASGARSAGGNDWSAPAADFRPQISAASIAMVERRSELEAVCHYPFFIGHSVLTSQFVPTWWNSCARVFRQRACRGPTACRVCTRQRISHELLD